MGGKSYVTINLIILNSIFIGDFESYVLIYE